MSDAELRALERRWTATPDDVEATQALIGARRRAGLSVPSRLLDARLFPPRTIDLQGRYVVRAELPDGSTALVGKTPASQPLELPAHRSWSLEPLFYVDERRFALLIEEARALRCPALRVTIGSPPRRVGERLAGLDDLERLALVGHGHLHDSDVVALAEAPNLHHLELEHSTALGDGAMSALARLGPLVRLGLKDCYSLGDSALSRLENVPALEELILDGTAVTARGVSALRSNALRRLSLRRCRLRAVDRPRRRPRRQAAVPLDLRGLPGLAWLDLTLSDLRPEEVTTAPAGLQLSAADPRVVLDGGLGGACPVQGVGQIAGRDLYFRARGQHWSFTVGDEQAPLFELEEPWGDGPYDAGYMPIVDAEQLLLRAANEFLARVDRGEIRLPGGTPAA